MKICRYCGNQMNDEACFCEKCGKSATAVAEEKREATPVPAPAPAPVPAPVAGESKFTGGAFANFFIGLLTLVVGVCTLGLLYPAMKCWNLRWKAKHTYVNGRRLVFDGKGIQLLGKFMLWILLSVVTLGIYFVFAMPLNMKRWEAKHTHFQGVRGESKFDGSVAGLFRVNFVSTLVTIVTLSFGAYWAHCYKLRWYTKHQTIDGCRLKFDGKGRQFFGKCIVWVLLTIVTLGVYSFWLAVKIENWTVSHKRLENPLALPVGERTKEIETEKPEKQKKEKKETVRTPGATKRSKLALALSILSMPFWMLGMTAYALWGLPVNMLIIFMVFGVIVGASGVALGISSVKRSAKRGCAVTAICMGAINAWFSFMFIFLS